MNPDTNNFIDELRHIAATSFDRYRRSGYRDRVAFEKQFAARTELRRLQPVAEPLYEHPVTNRVWM